MYTRLGYSFMSQAFITWSGECTAIRMSHIVSLLNYNDSEVQCYHIKSDHQFGGTVSHHGCVFKYYQLTNVIRGERISELQRCMTHFRYSCSSYSFCRRMKDQSWRNLWLGFNHFTSCCSKRIGANASY
jgi:hypothetical protein